MKCFLKILIVLGAAAGCIDVNLYDDLVLRDTDSGTEEPGVATDTAAILETLTDTSDVTPPVLMTTCGLAEIHQDDACLIDANPSLYIRFSTDEPAIVVSQSDLVDVLSPDWQMAHELIVLKNDIAQNVTLTVSDVNQNEVQFSVEAAPLLNPAVVITEVLADCFGEEPNNEYVKIANVGTSEVDLSGWMIDDNNDRNGDVIGEGTVLPAGVVATVAMTGFSGGAGMLVSLESAIGSSGLKNSTSESIQLLDGNGILMDEFTTTQGPEEGMPFVRRHVLLPKDAPEPWTQSVE